MSVLETIFGNPRIKKLASYQARVPEINALESGLENLTKEEILAKSGVLKSRAIAGEEVSDLLPEAFALVREVSRRQLKERHYDVQIVGGQVLHDKNIAEMRTGEGKTLVATLPAYLNSLSGKGVHIITVNDYLARRDATWMGQIYAALGVSVAVINHDSSYIYDESHMAPKTDEERDKLGSFKIQYDLLRPCTRKDAYQADITYGTNSEFGFDYLRDNIQYSQDRVVQRGHNYAIVDEVDSILIDEARTPLIISAPVAESESLYATFSKISQAFSPDEDYEVDEKLRAVQITEKGIEKAEKLLGVDNIYTEKGIKYVHHLETALRAKALFLKERDYVVKDGEAIIVDQSTGRMQPGRRWSEGLHQAIESKEGVRVQQESRTFASITYQNYFRLYEKLSGMTGTAETSAEEFLKVYDLDVISVPTHRPTARKDHTDAVFQSEMGKFKAVAKIVKELNKKGQPVLVGTVSIERNELLSEFLRTEGIQHSVLNAKKHEEEGRVIAEAGKRGSVTVATNMAGRGIDIKLGGPNATKEQAEEVKSLGGLFVLGTERHEARRIDNQLRGRAGRQGDPGETHFYVSLEDPLMKVFGSEKIKNLMGRFGVPEDQPIESSMISKSIEGAQTKVEGFHFDARKHLLEYDDVLNFQRKIIYERRKAILFGDDTFVLSEIDVVAAGDPEKTPDGVIGASEKFQALLREKRERMGEAELARSLRQMVLQVIDMLWVEHLEQMDYMRSSVRLRAYGQRDPLIEYKREGLKLFKDMELAIDDNIRQFLPNVGNIAQAKEEKDLKEVHKAADSITGAQSQPVIARRSDEPKVGRNDPCPCGSGKKWKNCGLINAPEHKKI
ncbi:MAG TPA: preprotein translocase subunit SecA [Candidatus Paceibacterota bacterium]